LIAFLDFQGGGLAMMAAAVAKSMGIEAQALAHGAVRVDHALVAEVLGEVGLSVGPAPTQLLDNAAAGPLIALGSGEPGLQTRARLNVRLYDGPAETAFGPSDLEARALLRIARDTMERFLEQAARS
jgi:hypothetical protein